MALAAVNPSLLISQLALEVLLVYIEGRVFIGRATS
jgi:hypothetical protein